MFFAIGVIAISLVDWPLRKFFKGQKFDRTKVVESSEASYDPVLGTELWEIMKEFSGVVEPAYGERFTSNDMFSAGIFGTVVSERVEHGRTFESYGGNGDESWH